VQDSRDSSRRRFDGPPGDRMPPPPSVSDEVNQWRSSKPLAKIPEPEAPSYKRRGSGFSTPEGQSPADNEDKWALGSKFKPSTEDPPSRFGSLRGSHDSQHARDPPADEGDWRAGRSRTSRKYHFQRIVRVLVEASDDSNQFHTPYTPDGSS
jgi:translation initiation factor 4B